MTKTPMEEFAPLYHELTDKHIEEMDAFKAAHGYNDMAFQEVFEYEQAEWKADPESMCNTTQAKVRGFLHATFKWVFPEWLVWKIVRLVKLPYSKETE